MGWAVKSDRITEPLLLLELPRIIGFNEFTGGPASTGANGRKQVFWHAFIFKK